MVSRAYQDNNGGTKWSMIRMTHFPASLEGLMAKPVGESLKLKRSGFKEIVEVPPSTDGESASLAVALRPTKKMFWGWTGQTVPQPDREKSYGQQYKELHKAFEDRRSGIAEGTLPVLAGVMQWKFSVDDWKTVQKDAVYYEAYRKVTALLTPEHRELLKQDAQAFGYIGIHAAHLDVPKC